MATALAWPSAPPPPQRSTPLSHPQPQLGLALLNPLNTPIL